MSKKTRKKDDKPYMPFYIGDWFKAPEVRALPHANRMVWFEVLCLMWQGEEKGYLTINKKPFVITDDITGDITTGQQVLGNMLGISYDFLQESFRLFKQLGVYKVREDGAIYSGFMVKLVKIQKVKSIAGKAGMESRYGNSVITPDITPFDNEIIYSIIKIVESNGLLNGEGENEKNILAMVIVEMEAIWKKYKPGYSYLQETDYPALLQIAYYIAARKGWTRHSITDIRETEVIHSWEKWVIFLTSEKTAQFFKKLTLDTIAKPNMLQKIEEAMKDNLDSQKGKMIL